MSGLSAGAFSSSGAEAGGLSAAQVVTLNANKNKNKVINGGFDIWQLPTSQTSNGFGSDDRWKNNNVGSTKTHSQQAFALGQTDVLGSPRYYSRTAVTSSAGATNFVSKQQKIEGVSTFEGQTVALSFSAKADASKDMAFSLFQEFGTGGSPSATTVFGVNTFSLTSSWQKFAIIIDVPSISGKTLGTNNNDSLGFNFWFDAGSGFDSLTNTLGQQSGTFDISNVQIELGDTATDFEQLFIGDILAQCQKYRFKTFPQDVAPAQNAGRAGAGTTTATSTGDFSLGIEFPVTMRTSPTITTYNPSAANSSARNITDSTDTAVTTTLAENSERGVVFAPASLDATDANNLMSLHIMASAEL